jgi:hypothetical protein
MTQPRDEQMVSRIVAPAAAVTGAAIRPGAPKLNIIIPAEDGTELVRMTEDARGHLVITGDESRWDEGAKRFLHGMMQWSGVVGVRWKDEVLRAVEGH